MSSSAVGADFRIRGRMNGSSYILYKGMEKMKRKRKSAKTKGQPLKKKQKNKELYFPSQVVDFSSPRDLTDTIDVTYGDTDKCFMIVKGQKLEKDVVTLLSNGGKRNYLVRNNGDKVSVDSVAGKHLLICCFKAPLPICGESAHTCRAMIAAYSQLREQNENFEMVMVAKMAGRRGEETAFNWFFKAFPCLAIPFWDVESRDFICSSLGLTDRWEHCAAVVVDPDQVVLQTDDRFFLEYGASGFPYTDDRLNAPVPLAELLGSDIRVSRFGGGGDENHEMMSVSDLSKKKCVALYLCGRGYMMERLEGIRKKCIDKNLEFEVLAIHIPFLCSLKAVHLALDRHQLSSWWVMNETMTEGAMRRLWRLASLHMDALFFLADGGNALEIEGERFINELGHGPEYYPFTRKTMAEDIINRLRPLTLESLIPVAELKGKKVLIYFDWCLNTCDSSKVYKHLVKYYDTKTDPDVEVVFVPLDDNKVPLDDDCRHHPWPKVLIGGGSIADRVFPHVIQPWTSIVAFGEDGHIVSRKAQDRLIKEGGSVDLFADTLLEEICFDLRYFEMEPDY